MICYLIISFVLGETAAGLGKKSLYKLILTNLVSMQPLPAEKSSRSSSLAICLKRIYEGRQDLRENDSRATSITELSGGKF